MNKLKLLSLLSIFAILAAGCFGKVELGQDKNVRIEKNATTKEGTISSRPADMPEVVYDAITKRKATIALKNQVINSILAIIKQNLATKVARDKAVDAAVSDAGWAQTIKNALDLAKPYNRTGEPKATKPSTMSTTLFNLLTQAQISEANKIKLVSAIELALTKTTQIERDDAIAAAVSDVGAGYGLTQRIQSLVDEESPFLLSKPFGLDAEIYELIKNHRQADIKQKNKIIMSSNNARNKSNETLRNQTIDEAIRQNGNFNKLGTDLKNLLAEKYPILMAKPANMEQSVYDSIRYEFNNVTKANEIIKGLNPLLANPDREALIKDFLLAQSASAYYYDDLIQVLDQAHPMLVKKPKDLPQGIYDVLKGIGSSLGVRNGLIRAFAKSSWPKNQAARDALVEKLAREQYISSYAQELKDALNKSDPLLMEVPVGMDGAIYQPMATSSLPIAKRNAMIKAVYELSTRVLSQADRDTQIEATITRNGGDKILANVIKKAFDDVHPILIEPLGLDQKLYDLVVAERPYLSIKEINALIVGLKNAMLVRTQKDRDNAIEVLVKTNGDVVGLFESLKERANEIKPFLSIKPASMLASIYQLITEHAGSSISQKNHLIEEINGALSLVRMDSRTQAIDKAIAGNGGFTALGQSIKAKVDDELPLLMAKPTNMPNDVFFLISMATTLDIKTRNKIIDGVDEAMKFVSDQTKRDEALAKVGLEVSQTTLLQTIKKKIDELQPILNSKPAAMAKELYEAIALHDVGNLTQKNELIKKFANIKWLNDQNARDEQIETTVNAEGGVPNLSLKVKKVMDLLNPILVKKPAAMHNSVYEAIANSNELNALEKNNILKAITDLITQNSVVNKTTRETMLKMQNLANFSKVEASVFYLLQAYHPLLVDKPTYLAQEFYEFITKDSKLNNAQKNSLMLALAKADVMLKSKIAERDQAIDEAVRNNGDDASLASGLKAIAQRIKHLTISKPANMDQSVYDELAKMGSFFKADIERFRSAAIEGVSKALDNTVRYNREASIRRDLSNFNLDPASMTLFLNLVQEKHPLLIDKPFSMDQSIFDIITGSSASVGEKNRIIETLKDLKWEKSLSGRNTMIEKATGLKALAEQLKNKMDEINPILIPKPADLNQEIYDVIAGYRLPNTYTDTVETIKSKNRIIGEIKSALSLPKKLERDSQILIASFDLKELAPKIIAKTEELIIDEKPFDMNQEMYDFIKGRGDLTIKEKNTLIPEINKSLKEEKRSSRDTKIYKAFFFINKRNTDIPDQFITKLDQIEPLLNDAPYNMKPFVYELIKKFSGMNIAQKNILFDRWKNEFGLPREKSERDEHVSKIVGAAHGQLIIDIQEALQKDKPLLLPKPAGFSQGIYDLIKSQYALDPKDQNLLLADMVEAIKILNLTARSNAIDSAVKKHPGDLTNLSKNLKAEAQKDNPLVIDMPVGMNPEIYNFIKARPGVTADDKNRLIEAISKSMARNFDAKDDRDLALRNDVRAIDQFGTKYPGLANDLIALVDRIAPIVIRPLDPKPAEMPQEVYEAIQNFMPNKFIGQKNQSLEPIKDAYVQALKESLDVDGFSPKLSLAINSANLNGLAAQILSLFKLRTKPASMKQEVYDIIETYNDGLDALILNRYMDEIQGAIGQNANVTMSKLKKVVAKNEILQDLDNRIIEALYVVKPSGMPDDVFKLIKDYVVATKIEREKMGEDGKVIKDKDGKVIMEKITQREKFLLEKIAALPLILKAIEQPVVTAESLKIGLDSKLSPLAEQIAAEYYTLKAKPKSMNQGVYNAIVGSEGGPNRYVMQKNIVIRELTTDILENLEILRPFKFNKIFNEANKLPKLRDEIFALTGSVQKPANMIQALFEIISSDDSAISVADKTKIINDLDMDDVSNIDKKSKRDILISRNNFSSKLNGKIIAFMDKLWTGQLSVSEAGLGGKLPIYNSIYSSINLDKYKEMKFLNDLALKSATIATKNYNKYSYKNDDRVEELKTIFDAHGVDDSELLSELNYEINQVNKFEDYKIKMPSGWDLTWDPVVHAPQYTVWTKSNPNLNSPDTKPLFEGIVPWSVWKIGTLNIDWSNNEFEINAAGTSKGCKALQSAGYKSTIEKLLHPDQACTPDKFSSNNIPGSVIRYCKIVAANRYKFIQRCRLELGLSGQ